MCSGGKTDPTSFVKLFVYSTNSSGLPDTLLVANTSMDLPSSLSCSTGIGTWHNITLPPIVLNKNSKYAYILENTHPTSPFGSFANCSGNYRDNGYDAGESYNSEDYTSNPNNKNIWYPWSRAPNCKLASFVFEIWGDSSIKITDKLPPRIKIVYPEKSTYNYTDYPKELNYTISDETELGACQYSINRGITNLTIVCGENITGLTPNEGDNIWLVNSNDSSGNKNNSYIAFKYNKTITQPPVNPPVINTSTNTSVNTSVNVSGNLMLISPINKIYNNQSILFSLNSTIKFAKLVYSDNGAAESILCTNCYGYKKIKTLNDENHVVVFRGIFFDGTNLTNQTVFLIDSKTPTISLIKPSNNRYTNGSDFYIKYSEKNLQNLILFYGKDKIEKNNCDKGKNQTCFLDVNLSSYNNKNITYRFRLVDVANNTQESRNITIKVDTAPPKITFFNISISGKYITFNLSISELNFNKIDYSDNNRKFALLCSSLRNNYCTKRIYFSPGSYNITIRVLDDAGNSAQKKVSFVI